MSELNRTFYDFYEEELFGPHGPDSPEHGRNNGLGQGVPHAGTGTSAAAAAKVKASGDALVARVRAYFDEAAKVDPNRPISCDEIRQALDEQQNYVNSALNRLHRHEVIVRVPREPKNRKGNSEQAYVLHAHTLQHQEWLTAHVRAKIPAVVSRAKLALARRRPLRARLFELVAATARGEVLPPKCHDEVEEAEVAAMGMMASMAEAPHAS